MSHNVLKILQADSMLASNQATHPDRAKPKISQDNATRDNLRCVRGRVLKKKYTHTVVCTSTINQFFKTSLDNRKVRVIPHSMQRLWSMKTNTAGNATLTFKSYICHCCLPDLKAAFSGQSRVLASQILANYLIWKSFCLCDHGFIKTLPDAWYHWKNEYDSY